MKSDPYLKLHIKINSRAWGGESVGASTLWESRDFLQCSDFLQCAPSIPGICVATAAHTCNPALGGWAAGSQGLTSQLSRSSEPRIQRPCFSEELDTLLWFLQVCM